MFFPLVLAVVAAAILALLGPVVLRAILLGTARDEDQQLLVALRSVAVSSRKFDRTPHRGGNRWFSGKMQNNAQKRALVQECEREGIAVWKVRVFSISAW